MSQSAHGSGNIQVAVAASEHVNININGQLAVQLEVRQYPIPLPQDRHEIDLLKAVHAQVPFTGRQALLDDFLQWCSDSRALSMRTIIGQGGAGKTRFAYELYARVRQQPDWAAYFLRVHKNEAKEVDLWREIKNKNALIIADYAADGAQPLADLLRPLAGNALEGHKLRVLLLARTASWEQGWLAGLASGRTGEDVDRHFHPREPIVFPPFSPEERQAIFQETVARAAKYMGKQVLRQQISLAEFERKEVAERLADPLTLMMAALMTLESGASALSLNRTDLAFEASQKLVADRMKEAVKNHKDLFLHMAAYATLCGGLQEEEALAILEGESRETHLGNVPDPKAFLERLQAWLPGEKTKTWIGVIEPDIVGEAFVLGKGKRPHLQSAEAAVMRAAGHKSGPTVQALVRMAQDFSFAEAEERLEPLEWLAKLIESGEADNNLALLIDLSDALPESSVVLTEIGVSISTILCDRLRRLFEAVEGHPSTELQSLFAVSLIILSIRQSAVGQWETALATNEEAVVLYRELMARNRDAYLPELAMALNNLANRQREAGQRETALATAEQAIALRRELVTRDRDTFLPNLAMSLNNLAVMQSDAGKKNEALVTAQEAVVVYRELAARNRDAALSDLAMSLNTLALRQLAAKHQNEALVAAHETAALYRELAGRNRDAFLPDLAMSLNNLATIQSDRQRETALATAWEAATLYKELAERNPDAFLSDLAVSLTTLARLQSMAEQHEAALAVAQEATAICRQLATSNYASFQERLARACGILGVTLTALGRHTDAAASFAEGIRTVLPSVKQYPVAYVELYIVLLGEYLSAAKAASIEPDEALVQETFPVLDPYLTKEGEQP